MGTQVRKHPQPLRRDAIEDDDYLYETRMPSSARRYRPFDTIEEPITATAHTQSSIQQRRASRTVTTDHPVLSLDYKTSGALPTPRVDTKPGKTKQYNTGKNTTASVTPVQQHSHKRVPVIALLIGAVVTAMCLMSLSFFSSWWQNYQDDLHYGNPRTTQFDAVVGHNDSQEHLTHFVIINLHGHIQIIETPGGDTAHTHVYTGPTLYGEERDKVPVIPSVRQENGHIDLILQVQNQQIVFVNDGDTFHMQGQSGQ